MTRLLFEQKGSIGWLTLNNPDNLNAMTHEMGEAIQEMVPKLNANKELRVVILSGAGRAFSAGGDLQFILDHSKKSLAENQKEMVEFYGKFLTLRDIEVPTIAMLNGPAIGAGLLIALACDLRYAVAGTKLAANFVKLGISSGMGGLYWLTKIVGPARAADLLLTGRTFTSEEGLALGLLNGIFSMEQLKPQVQAIAEQIAQNAPISLKIIKKGIQKAVTASLEEVIDYESRGQAQTFITEDLLEGVAAIREKRPPKFQGK
jgi:enoyl-CoA hydratase